MVSFEEHEKYKWLASGYKYEIQMFAVLWKHFEFLFEARLEGCLLKHFKWYEMHYVRFIFSFKQNMCFI